MAELQDLNDLFRKLGASEPDAWAASQIEEGINQLGRFLFLREAWRRVIPEDDHSWIESEIGESALNFGKPCSGTGKALDRLLATGADKQDISDVVRGMQYDLLFSLCYLLDGPEDLEPDVANISWALVEIDEDGEPGASIAGLHESVLEMDPTGREMRPRPTTVQ